MFKEEKIPENFAKDGLKKFVKDVLENTAENIDRHTRS